jgi:hypothetical protein
MCWRKKTKNATNMFPAVRGAKGKTGVAFAADLLLAAAPGKNR